MIPPAGAGFFASRREAGRVTGNPATTSSRPMIQKIFRGLHLLAVAGDRFECRWGGGEAANGGDFLRKAFRRKRGGWL